MVRSAASPAYQLARSRGVASGCRLIGIARNLLTPGSRGTPAAGPSAHRCGLDGRFASAADHRCERPHERDDSSQRRRGRAEHARPRRGSRTARTPASVHEVAAHSLNYLAGPLLA